MVKNMTLYVDYLSIDRQYSYTLKKREIIRAEKDLKVGYSLIEPISSLSFRIFLLYFEHGPHVPYLLFVFYVNVLYSI